MYFLGLDIGSSSIKAALVDGATNKQIAVAQYPETEMDMISVQSGWAEQEPEVWWKNACAATQKALNSARINPMEVAGIGISYQMHGLVLVDKNHEVLRPAIIWCDSRAVEIGEEAFQGIGAEKCHQHLLNAPGNFTASKLKWVKENEPELFAKIHKILLPGDYIALKLTGENTTTVSGLSEGIFWDFQNNEVAGFLMDHLGFDPEVIPAIVPTFGDQGRLSVAAAREIGLKPGIGIGYRAGDQPNNALALGVINPGEVAATGGTSGVVYGVKDEPVYDLKSRVNSFAHVNHATEDPRIGVLLCINGAGIQYRYIKQMMAEEGLGYTDMERVMTRVPIGADELRVIPFGNGAERILSNRNIGAQVNNLQFNRHKKEHFYRAALEGVAFSFIYGIEILKELGLEITKLRVGNDNLFQSAIFSKTISTLANAPIELVETTGAVGAARGAAYAQGHFSSLAEAVSGDATVNIYEPTVSEYQQYSNAYQAWVGDLKRLLND
ncbi:MAG: FGGY family carbohydrate kinase [Marinoscillum sp.]|uniref:xylulokinase n=1 Tax=Marinoscillum sp. TaxID=2024838 RepID=UPI00330375C7